jgi:uncharacterized protein YhbP (UPF0306 family)
MKFTQTQIRQQITDFLKSHGILTLAVSHNDKPWVCTLYYGLDDDLTMYLVSDPGSDHGQVIAQNPKVAFNIFDSRQPITLPKQGVQGKGTIRLVKGLKENLKGLRLWHHANPGIEKNITIDDLKKIPNTKLYNLTPTYFKFFNKELYGSAEHGILDLQKET